MINYKKITIGFILAMLIFGFSNSKATNTQHNQLFDFGWKFFLGDNPNASKSDFNDSKWRSVDLPHDWSIEGHFDQIIQPAMTVDIYLLA
jgi:beta-galactosidase